MLLTVRLVGTFTSLVLLILGLLQLKLKLLLYFTPWGLLMCGCGFAGILLRNRYGIMYTIAVDLVPVAWLNNVANTVIYWCIVFPLSEKEFIWYNIPAHTVPMVALTIELLANQIEYKRKHQFTAFLIHFIYIACVNLPFTLARHPLYGGFTYRNAITYIAYIVIVLVYFVVGQLAIRLKEMLINNRRAEFERILQLESLKSFLQNT